MANDFGMMNGLTAGFSVAAGIAVVKGVADILWSYIPIGDDGETLSDYVGGWVN